MQILLVFQYGLIEVTEVILVQSYVCWCWTESVDGAEKRDKVKLPHFVNFLFLAYRVPVLGKKKNMHKMFLKSLHVTGLEEILHIKKNCRVL